MIFEIRSYRNGHRIGTIETVPQDKLEAKVESLLHPDMDIEYLGITRENGNVERCYVADDWGTHEIANPKLRSASE